MTILKPPLGRIRNRLSQKIVIDRSMTILKPPLGRIRNRLSQKIVIDWSMTIFSSSMDLLKAENHAHLWTYHLWPYVIDHRQ